MWTFTRRLNFVGALLLLGVMAAVAGKTPRPLLDISIDGLNAQRYRPVEARGKIRLIAMFTSDCESCKKTVGTLNRLDAQYKAKGVVFYGALVNALSLQNLTAFIKETKPVYPMGMLTKENTMRLADFQEKERPFAPILLFVDKKNMVIYQIFGNEGADSEVVIKGFLDTMLKEK